MTEVAVRTPMEEVVATVRGDQFLDQVRAALPGNVTAERFVRVTVTALQQTPDLITADRGSLFRSVIRCAQDGLLPDGREAALVKFGNDATYMPMIGGLRKIAAKHGITLNAYVVYEKDDFDYTLGESPHIHHKPPKLGEDRGAPIGAYAVATYQDGAMVCPPEVMSKQEIELIRQESKAKNSGPWTKHWTEMARKTVGRRQFKQLPLGDLDEVSSRIIEQADVDAEHEVADVMTVEEANLSVAASATIDGPRLIDDDGPDDTLAGEQETIAAIEELHQESFQEQADRAQAARAGQ